MTQPQWVERLLLVIAITNLWAISVGTLANSNLFPSSLPETTKARSLSCFVLGLNHILAAALHHDLCRWAASFPRTGSKLPAIIKNYPCMHRRG